jgi:hypothetical protein
MADTPTSSRNTQSTKINEIEVRVGKIESVLESITRQVEVTTKGIQNLSSGIQSFKEDILKQLGTVSQPKWPLLAGISTLVVTILSLCGTMIIFSLSGQSSNISENNAAIVELREKAYEERFEDGKFAAWQERLDSQILLLVNDFTEFRAYTDANRWTKDDHYRFEETIGKRMEMVEGILRKENPP